jgi:hypothetical protein
LLASILNTSHMQEPITHGKGHRSIPTSLPSSALFRSQRGLSRTRILVDLGIATALAIIGCLWFARQTGLIDPLVRVDDDAVGVLIDYGSGELSGPIGPGYKSVLPFSQELWVLDRSPRELLLEGSDKVGPWHVPRLIVRARDGSSFWFDRVLVQTTLDPTAAPQVLRDTGRADERRAALVQVSARAILGEELGRFDAADVLLADKRREAVDAARDRLSVALASHGVRVMEISLSRPSFDPRWEQTIERRKVAEQKVHGLERESQLVLSGETAAHANLRRKLELQLEKDSFKWARELEDLTMAATLQQEQRADALTQLQSVHEVRMTRDRAKWNKALSALAEKRGQMQVGREHRLERVRQEHSTLLQFKRDEWAKAESDLSRLVASAPTREQSALELVRSKDELEVERMRATIHAERSAADQTAASLLSASSTSAADQVSKARIQRDGRVALAAVLQQRYQSEVDCFRAETESLARAGPAVVRAALIEGLEGIQFELVPPSPAAPYVATQTKY